MHASHAATTAVTRSTNSVRSTGRRFLAMPLAGAIAWTTVGVAGLFLRPELAALALFVCTGFIVSRACSSRTSRASASSTGTKPKNAFDGLFFHTVGMSLLVYALAIPFYMTEVTSLPLGVGVLTGLSVAAARG